MSRRVSDERAAGLGVVIERLRATNMLDGAWRTIVDLLADRATDAAEIKRLRAVCEAFADTAERAVAHHRAPKTGMQVPYHDDFANVSPSVVGRLEGWARRFREVLGGEDATTDVAKEMANER